METYLLVSSFNGDILFEGTEEECERRIVQESIVIPKCNYDNYIEYLQDQYEKQVQY